MIGSMAAVPLPDGPPPSAPSPDIDPLQDHLLFDHGIEVPIIWPHPPRRLLRVSAQTYNSFDEYEKLAGALRETLIQG